ncbi:carbohydrate-binding protein [Micromonosporaceae bacterium Da 78-11]
MTAPTTPSVYRARSHVQRKRVLSGLAAAGLLLVGYGIGRWQDTPADPPTALPAAAGSTVASAAASSAAPTTDAPTTQAPTPTVYPTLQAEAADGQNGIQSQDTEDEGGGKNVGWIADGDSLRFDDFDFGAVPATKFEARVAADTEGGRMEIHIDGPDKPAIGTMSVTKTGGWQKWRTDVGSITPVTGVHTVFLTFARDDGNEFLNLNWIKFQQ